MLLEQAIAGGSMKDMSRDLAERWSKAANMEDTKFTDASGRVWNTKTYIQMNVRTNTMRVYNDVLADTVARETGGDLMRISTGGDQDCDCAAWEGCIISLTGKTKGFPTYDDARNGGCFHPNCTHTLEYVDETVDAQEIELQKSHPFNESEGSGAESPSIADAQDERKYEIDQARYMRDNPGMTQEQARVAVDRDNLAASIQGGLIREDAREIVSKMTDAQVTALCPNGNPPAFEPVKIASKRAASSERAASAAVEKWNHGSRGGTVHIARNASAEHILEICKVTDAQPPEEPSKPDAWQPSTDLERSTDALTHEIGATHTDAQLSINGENPNYASDREWQNNCQRCVPTYEARLRGYDVTALSSVGDRTPGTLNLAHNSRAMWKNQDAIYFRAKGFKSGVEKKMKEWGNGARAEIRIGWSRRKFGHVFFAVQENGNTHYVDPQHPQSNASAYFARAAKSGRNAKHWILRTDNNEFTEEAKRCFQPNHQPAAD